MGTYFLPYPQPASSIILYKLPHWSTYFSRPMRDQIHIFRPMRDHLPYRSNLSSIPEYVTKREVGFSNLEDRLILFILFFIQVTICLCNHQLHTNWHPFTEISSTHKLTPVHRNFIYTQIDTCSQKFHLHSN